MHGFWGVNLRLWFFSLSRGVIKHQVNVDTHSPGCKMAENKTKISNTSHMVWCSEEPVFQADEPEVDCVDEA